jgi:hypothetical protein
VRTNNQACENLRKENVRCTCAYLKRDTPRETTRLAMLKPKTLNARRTQGDTRAYLKADTPGVTMRAAMLKHKRNKLGARVATRAYLKADTPRVTMRVALLKHVEPTVGVRVLADT